MNPRTSLCVLCVLCASAVNWSPASGLAQEREKKQADIERMVRDGMVEALDVRLAGDKSPDSLALLTRAQVNKAAKARDEKQRTAAFEDAEKRFERWIAAAEAARDVTSEQRTVSLATARVALGGMILSKWVAPDLDEIELYNGRKGDAARAVTLLSKARKAYEAAQRDIEPLTRALLDRRTETEDRYLELGVFEPLNRLKLDIQFNLGWTLLFLARCDARNAEVRAPATAAAERAFRDLIDLGQTGETAARCELGLAMALREQSRFDDAQKSFAAALKDAGPAPLGAQVRYEQARCEIAAGKFDDARKTLAPLVAKGQDELSADDRPAKFYINLAQVWDGYSFLVEADRLRDEAGTSAVKQNLLQRAARARETGMARLNALSSRGGPWPGLVGAYVAATIRSDADVKTLSPGELLFSARQLYEDKKCKGALARLEEAVARKDLAPEMFGELLFQIGLCRFQMKDQREAAEAFGKLATTLRTHAKAPQAAAYCYELWSAVAEESKSRADYLRFADALTNVIANYPKHEKRDEALWWLPVAYQSAGEYEKAIELFAKVPSSSARWEEAQYRKAMSARLAFETQRAGLSDAERAARGNRIADELAAYAKAAEERADKSRDPKQTGKWAATALVTSAELRAAPALGQFQAALTALSDFEQRHPDSDQVGRVLAVRINAYRGLRKFEEAGKVVEQFLQTVSAAQAGGVLASVARGMQDEVERLERDGRAADAHRLATDAIPTFEQLTTWASTDPARAQHLDAITFGAARMNLAAGQFAKAELLLKGLLEKAPQMGAYQHAYARSLWAQLGPDASPDQIAASRRAWEQLLQDVQLRTQQPEVYWEARVSFLELLLREGKGQAVANAIDQEEIWFPELGGERWRNRFRELREQAENKTDPTRYPATDAAPDEHP